MSRQCVCGFRMLGCVFTALVILPALFSPAFAETYYVSPQGADTNNGTSAAPFASPQKGLDVAKPGDKVLVRAGVYRGRVVFPMSGEPGKPIILEGELGAILDGGEVVKDWQPAPEVAPGVYKKLIDIPEWNKIRHERAPEWRHHPFNLTWNNKLVLHIGNGRMKDGKGMERLKEPSTSGNWKKTGALYGTKDDVTYLRFGDNRDPNQGEITVGPRWEYDAAATVLVKGKRHIIIRGFVIRNLTVGVSLKTGASDNIVENNTIMGGKHGVFVGYYIWDVPKNSGQEVLCHRNHIRNNRITLDFIAKLKMPMPGSGWLWYQFKKFSDNDREGVALYSAGHDNQVYGNHIFEHWGGIQDWAAHDNMADAGPVVLKHLQFCQRLKVFNNVIHDILDDGLEPTGGEMDAEWHHNTVFNCASNLRLKFPAGGPCYIYCNKFFMSPAPYTDSPGDIFHFCDNKDARVYVYHNSFASDRGSKCSGALTNYPACSNSWYVNNIFSNHNFDRLPAGAHAGYNLVASEVRCSITGGHNIVISGERLWDEYEQDPSFELEADSPAREKGLDLSREWTLDGVRHPALPGMRPGYFSGRAPDLGAVQYGGKTAGGRQRGNLKQDGEGIRQHVAGKFIEFQEWFFRLIRVKN